MSLRSVEEILKFVTQQPNWETYREYCHLVECWRSLVSSQIAAHTRPLAISRQVLWVATSSAAWAQNMSLQRYSLLRRLNPMLAEPLEDIRFSSALWHNVPQDSAMIISVPTSEQPHPSDLPQETRSDEQDASSNNNFPSTSFDRWVTKIHLRAQNLPPCPLCQAPTPPGELQRWNCCALCASLEWQT